MRARAEAASRAASPPPTFVEAGALDPRDAGSEMAPTRVGHSRRDRVGAGLGTIRDRRVRYVEDGPGSDAVGVECSVDGREVRGSVARVPVVVVGHQDPEEEIAERGTDVVAVAGARLLRGVPEASATPAPTDCRRSDSAPLMIRPLRCAVRARSVGQRQPLAALRK